MTKKEARKAYKQLRESLSDDQKKSVSHSICQKLMKLDWKGKVVHVFLPIEHLNELDLWEFIYYCYAENISVCTSISNFEDYSMKTILLDKHTILKENKWKIPEPQNGSELDNSQIDVVLIPLLYADKNGNRVGYGKGFYDRFLSSCKPNVKKNRP